MAIRHRNQERFPKVGHVDSATAGEEMPSIFATNRTALVTGASSGIGLELSKALAPQIDSLILVARQLERLERLGAELGSRCPGLKIAVEAADLPDPEGCQRLLRWLEEGGRDFCVPVNSADLGESESFENTSWSRIQQMIDVNILASLRPTHSLPPGMIAQIHGAILNVGSGAG